MWPFVFVKQNHRVILERLGKYRATLEPGLNFKMPFLDQVAYELSLKERILDIGH